MDRFFPRCCTNPRHLRFHLLCAALCLLALAGLARAGEPAPPGPEPGTEGEGEGKIVREIQVRGNLRVDTGTVLRMIRTRVGRPFERKVWDEDWHRLTNSGYFLNVRTTAPIDSVGGVILVVDLVEMATVKKIEFKGAGAASPADLRAAIKTTEGGRFQRGQVHQDAQALEKFYHDRAYRDATVTYAVETVSSHKQLVAGQESEVQDEVLVTFKIEEGNPVSVRKLDFVGNQALSADKLQGIMSTRPKRLFRAGDLKDFDLETDQKRLQQFYLREGYMDVSIDKVDVQVSGESYWNWFRKRKKLADVTFYITEGPQYRVGTVKIAGNRALESAEIQTVMKIKPGAVYSPLLLNEDSQRVKELYGEYGRVFTRVDGDSRLVADPERLKKQPHLFDVEFAIHEGSEVSVREVVTRGNTKTRDKVIIRSMQLFPGDRIDTTKIRVAKEELKKLNYFEDDIRISPEPTENPEEADLVIDVAEKSTGEFNFGVGVSSLDSFFGNVRLTQRNFDYRDLPKSWRDFISGNSFVGAGETFSIDLTAGVKRQKYQVSYYEPWAFDRPIRMGGSIFRTVDSNFKDFNETSTGFSLTAGRRLWSPRWDGDVTYRFSYTQIGGTVSTLPHIFNQQDGDRLLSSVTPRLLYSSRDSNILPSRGIYFEASLEMGGGPFLGSLDWVRPTVNAARYFTVYKAPNGGKHILEVTGQASMIESYLGTKDVPPFQRYFGGGMGTIRGFENRTVSPQENGFYIGGKKLVAASAEYSVPLYEEIVRASVFTDAANVFDPGITDPGTRVTNQGGWRASVGLGLAIRTPLSPAPIRVFLSRPILKNDQDREKLLDFTFGTRF